MYLNQFEVGTSIDLIVKVSGQEINLKTEILGVVPTYSNKYGYGIICKPIIIKEKLIDFCNFHVSLNIFNNVDNRIYKFNTSCVCNDRQRKLLLIYSPCDSKAEENRDAFRIPCLYDVVLRIGNNAKCIDAYTHDISYSGASFVFDKESAEISVGSFVSASIYDKEGHIYRVSGRVVRTCEDFNPELNFTGVKFSNDCLRALVSKLQLREARLKRMAG